MTFIFDIYDSNPRKNRGVTLWYQSSGFESPELGGRSSMLGCVICLLDC